MASRVQFAAPSHGAAASFRQLVHPGAVDTGSVNKSLLAEDGGRLLLRAAHTLPKTTLDSDLKDVATGDFGPPPVTGVDAINLTSVLDASILDKYFALSGGWLPPRTFGFEPGKPQGQMSMTNAFALGKLAQLVYWDKRYITQWASQWGFADDEDHLAFVSMGDETNSGGTQCLMLRDKNVIIIVFRGTRPVYMQDWLADLEKGADLVPVDFGGTTVNIHIGFNKLLGKVMGAVAAKLKEWKRSNGTNEPELYVTGHSLGAALATLCAARLTLDPEYNDILPVYSVYTYGCPRVGDKLWKELYDSHLVLNRTTYRFVNNNDIVPRVPLDMPDGILGMYRVVVPALEPLGNLPFMRDIGNFIKKIPVPSWAADWMPVNADALTYEHVGVQYYIDRHGHVLDDIDALPRVVDGILGGGLFAPDLIIDHFMASYMRGLEFTLMGTLLSTALDKVTGITAANGKVTGVSDLKPLLEKSSHFAV